MTQKVSDNCPQSAERMGVDILSIDGFECMSANEYTIFLCH